MKPTQNKTHNTQYTVGSKQHKTYTNIKQTQYTAYTREHKMCKTQYTRVAESWDPGIKDLTNGAEFFSFQMQ